MDVYQLRKAADQLNDLANHLSRGPMGALTPTPPGFNWQALIQLLVVIIPQIIALFTNPQPSPPA